MTAFSGSQEFGCSCHSPAIPLQSLGCQHRSGVCPAVTGSFRRRRLQPRLGTRRGQPVSRSRSVTALLAPKRILAWGLIGLLVLLPDDSVWASAPPKENPQ